jgi:hypothetical protein
LITRDAVSPSMPSRRDVLALLAAAPLAGCGGDSERASTVSPLSNRTVAVVGDRSFPADSGVTLTDDVAAAEAVVLSAADDHHALAADALARETPVVFVGAGAPGHAHAVCERTARPYGLPSDSWTESERAAAVVPRGDRLDAQYLEPRFGASPTAQLQWAVGAVLAGRPPEVPVDDPPRPEGGVELGWVRVGGRTDVGDYDRWDRATLFPARRRAVVETVATVDAVDASLWNQYRVDGVEVRTSFSEAAVEATGHSAAPEGFSVSGVRDPERGSVTHEFSPAGGGPRRAAVGVRTVVSLDRPASPFAYLGNVRFRWRRGGILRDDSWIAHTPGRAVWRGHAP